jgi:hypothetical protein
MDRRVILIVLLLAAGTVTGSAQTIGPLFAPGLAAPQSSYNNPPAPAETYSDRVSRCTHYGTSIGVQPNDIGSYVAQCVHSN